MKDMALVLFIYDVDFINLAQRLVLGAREILSPKVELAPAHDPYTAQMHHTDDETDHDAFEYNNMKYIAKDLKEVIEQGAYALVLSSAVQLALSYRPFAQMK